MRLLPNREQGLSSWRCHPRSGAGWTISAWAMCPMCRSGLECFVLPYDVLVIGRPSCDLVFTGLPTWPNVGRDLRSEFDPLGGGAFNAVAALHARAPVRLVGIVGSDSWSERSLDAIRSEGVPTDLLLALDRPLPSVSVCLTHAGDRGFVTYEPPAEDVRDAFIEHALDVVVRQCGGYPLLADGSIASLRRGAGAGHARAR